MLKRVGRLPIAVFLLIYYLPALAFFTYTIFFKDDTMFWKILDCIVLGTLFLWLLLALFIHPVCIKKNSIVITHFGYPFREQIDIQTISKITYQEVPVVLGRVKCLTLHTPSKQKNIFITDVEDFCTKCLSINNRMSIPLDLV